MSTFDPALDGARISTQETRVRMLMSDQQWRTLRDIAEVVGGVETGISARLRGLRKAGYRVERRRRGTGGLWEYQVWPPPPEQPAEQQVLFDVSRRQGW